MGDLGLKCTEKWVEQKSFEKTEEFLDDGRFYVTFRVLGSPKWQLRKITILIEKKELEGAYLHSFLKTQKNQEMPIMAVRRWWV